MLDSISWSKKRKQISVLYIFLSWCSLLFYRNRFLPTTTLPAYQNKFFTKLRQIQSLTFVKKWDLYYKIYYFIWNFIIVPLVYATSDSIIIATRWPFGTCANAMQRTRPPDNAVATSAFTSMAPDSSSMWQWRTGRYVP